MIKTFCIYLSIKILYSSFLLILLFMVLNREIKIRIRRRSLPLRLRYHLAAVLRFFGVWQTVGSNCGCSWCRTWCWTGNHRSGCTGTGSGLCWTPSTMPGNSWASTYVCFQPPYRIRRAVRNLHIKVQFRLHFQTFLSFWVVIYYSILISRLIFIEGI